jgi:transposase
MEATGGLQRKLAAELSEAGHVVAVVNPRQARDFAKAIGRLTKTDKVDADVLAQLARILKPVARPLPGAPGRSDSRICPRVAASSLACAPASSIASSRPRSRT